MRRNLLLLAATTVALSSMACVPAQAGLLGAGNTVQAIYVDGSFNDLEYETSTGSVASPTPESLASTANFAEGTIDGSTISVSDTQITITNLLTPGTGEAYCYNGTAGTGCTDPIDGFEFLFTGENITSVSIDPSTTTGFLPVSGTFQGNTHDGLQLINNNEILVDITGDDPPTNGQLIIDINNGSSSPTPTPEPTSLALLASAALGIGTATRRRWRR